MGVAVFVTALVLHMQAVQHRQAALEFPVWPAQGTITSPYGHDGARWHPGIDIGTLRSLRVRAAVPGRVILVWTTAWVRGLRERRRRALAARTDRSHGHLAGVAVRAGERVHAGQHIATAGCTGWCTGAHLHFEVRRRGSTSARC